jgi:hypothetical protein
VAFSPQANYTDWTIATCRRNLVPTFADRGVSRDQRGGSRKAVNLSFLDRRRYTRKENYSCFLPLSTSLGGEVVFVIAVLVHCWQPENPFYSSWSLWSQMCSEMQSTSWAVQAQPIKQTEPSEITWRRTGVSRITFTANACGLWCKILFGCNQRV